MGDRVELAFDASARALFPRGSGVLAAVSGGGDSVALLVLLARLRERFALRIVVAHLDHGLHRGSPAQRRFVERLARTFGLPVICARRAVPKLRRRDESPEEAARRVRRQFLLAAAKRARCAAVATGHTLDDQAETILMRLARGAGPSSWTAMSPAGPGPFARPLLGIERAELRAYLARKRVRYVEDPTNDDLRVPRNRVRGEVLPLLAAAVNPRAARHLVEAAERGRADAALLDRLADAELERATLRRRGRRLALSAARLAGLDVSLSGRVVRAALARAGVDPRRISAKHVAAVTAIARGTIWATLDLPGMRAERKGHELILRAPVLRPSKH